jgi:hypothetical protein
MAVTKAAFALPGPFSRLRLCAGLDLVPYRSPVWLFIDLLVQRLGVFFARLTQPFQPSPIPLSGRPAHRPLRQRNEADLQPVACLTEPDEQ